MLENQRKTLRVQYIPAKQSTDITQSSTQSASNLSVTSPLRKQVSSVISNLEHVLHDLENVVTDMKDLVENIDRVTNTIDVQFGLDGATSGVQSQLNVRQLTRTNNTRVSNGKVLKTNKIVSRVTDEKHRPKKFKKSIKSRIMIEEEGDYSALSDISYVSDDEFLMTAAYNSNLRNGSKIGFLPADYKCLDQSPQNDAFALGDNGGYDHLSGEESRWLEIPATRKLELSDDISDNCSIDDFNSTTFAWDSHGIEFLEELHTKYDLSLPDIENIEENCNIDEHILKFQKSESLLEPSEANSCSKQRTFTPHFHLDLRKSAFGKNIDDEFKQSYHGDSTVASPCVICRCETDEHKKDQKYCSVYEREMESCLESETDGFDGDSFSDCSECTSDYYEIESIENGSSKREYTPTYDREINTWTSYALVLVDNEDPDQQYETHSDILNDNITTSSTVQDFNTLNTLSSENDVCTTSNGTISSFTDEIIKTYALSSASTVDVINTSSKRRSLPDIIKNADKQGLGRYISTN